MKTLTIIALTALAVQVNAATITWGLGADIYLMKAGEDFSTAKVAYESDLTVDSAAYLALVYVGSNVSTFDVASITSAAVVDSTPYDLDTDNASYADWNPASITTDVLASSYADGSSFAVVWFNGKSFDYVYSIDDGSEFNRATTIADMTRGSADIAPAATTSGYGGVIAVPEPSTAALALAGLALLLKRRKA